MKLTQKNDFDTCRTIFEIEVAKQDIIGAPFMWVPMDEPAMCMSKFLYQLADLAEVLEAEAKARGCAPPTRHSE